MRRPNKYALLLIICFVRLSVVSLAQNMLPVIDKIVLRDNHYGSMVEGCAPGIANIELLWHNTGSVAADSLSINLDYGDGTDSIWIMQAPSAGLPVKIVSSHIYQSGTYTVSVRITTINSVIYGNSNTLTYSARCASIIGNVYLDKNASCEYDAEDEVLPWEIVRVASDIDTLYTLTNNVGSYQFLLPAGQYYVVSPGYYLRGEGMACRDNVVGVTTVADQFSVADFGIRCNNAIPDYSVQILSAGVVPDSLNQIGIHVASGNICHPASLKLKVKFPPALRFENVSYNNFPVYDSATQEYTWPVPASYMEHDYLLRIIVFADTGLANGQPGCITAKLISDQPDANPSNDSYTLCPAVIAADYFAGKAVAPHGYGQQGFIPVDTRLTYMVGYQNRFDFFTRHTTIKDFLDEDLDMSTLKIVWPYWDMTANIIGNELNFDLTNSLVWAGINDADSRWGVLYSVKPKKYLQPGTQVYEGAEVCMNYNTGDSVFDKCIITNTPLNTIAVNGDADPDSIEHIVIYPNPADEQVFVLLPAYTEARLRIFDVSGRLVENAGSIKGQTIIDTRYFSPGIYLMRFTDKRGASQTLRLSVMHP